MTRPFDFRLRSPALVLLSVVTFAVGCRTSRETVVEKPVVVEAADFDPHRYPDPEPERALEIRHDLPQSLLGGPAENRPDRSEPRTVSGFRIQVSSNRVRTEANQALQMAISWWTDYQVELDENADTSSPPVYIEWEQPYWKVRLGNFQSRQEALKLLGEVRSEFTGAFIVPSPVVIQ